MFVKSGAALVLNLSLIVSALAQQDRGVRILPPKSGETKPLTEAAVNRRPDFLLVFWFTGDKTGMKTFYRVIEKNGVVQYEVVPKENRIPAGSIIEYRVVGINPFRFTASGKNDHFDTDNAKLSAEAKKIWGDGLAPAEVKKEESPALKSSGTNPNSGRALTVDAETALFKAQVDTIVTKTDRLKKLASEKKLETLDVNSLSNLRNLKDGLSESSPLTVEKMQSAIGFLEGQKKIVGNFASSGAQEALRKTRLGVLGAYDEGLLAFYRWKEALKAATEPGDQVAEIERFFKDIALDPGPAQRLSSALATIGNQAGLLSRLISLTRSARIGPDNPNLPGKSAFMDDVVRGTVAALRCDAKEAAKSAFPTEGTPFREALLSQYEVLSGMASAQAAEVNRVMKLVESVKSRAKSLLSQFADERLMLRGERDGQTKPTLERAIEISRRIDLLSEAEDDLVDLSARAESYGDKVKASVEELKKKVDKAKEDQSKVEKTVIQAEALYGQIQRTTFEITPSIASQARAGRITYSLEIREIGDDGAIKDAVVKDQFDIDIYSEAARTTIEATATYVFSTIKQREFRKKEGSGGKDNLFRFVDSPSDDLNPEIAVMFHLPVKLNRPDTWAYTFGMNTTTSSFYGGLTYLYGREKGAALSVGAVLSKVKVIEDNPWSADPILNVRDRYRTGLYFGIGWRM